MASGFRHIAHLLPLITERNAVLWGYRFSGSPGEPRALAITAAQIAAALRS